MRAWIIGFCVLFPLVVFARPPVMLCGGLDGRCLVTITQDDDTRQGGERDIKDTLTFKGGKFTSEAFVKRGFPPSAYEEEMHPGGAGNFNALQTNSSAEQGT